MDWLAFRRGYVVGGVWGFIAGLLLIGLALLWKVGKP